MGIFLFVVHSLIFLMVRGSFFNTIPASLLFFYLIGCVIAYSFLYSVLSQLEEDANFIFNGTLSGIFIFAPFVYIWVKTVR